MMHVGLENRCENISADAFQGVRDDMIQLGDGMLDSALTLKKPGVDAGIGKEVGPPQKNKKNETKKAILTNLIPSWRQKKKY